MPKFSIIVPVYNVEKYINEEQEVYVLKNLSEDEENKLKEVIETEKPDNWIAEDISENWKYNSEHILIEYSATNEYEDSTNIFIRKLDVCD